ncbi:hypothetical protein HOG48_05615 [Candidatus Peregrinibacteria bacterium]|jgi:hypothetical protein|nr:hypothetical protein [Candidatus Peregrinibacteria bacterium]
MLKKEPEQTGPSLEVTQEASLRHLARRLTTMWQCNASFIDRLPIEELRAMFADVIESQQWDDDTLRDRATEVFVTLSRDHRKGDLPLRPEIDCPDDDRFDFKSSIARQLGAFRAAASEVHLRGPLLEPDWAADRRLERTARILYLRDWQTFLGNFAEFAASSGMIDFSHKFTTKDLMEFEPAARKGYSNGFKYLSPGIRHPKLDVHDLGCGNNSHVLTLSRMDDEIEGLGLPTNEAFAFTGHTLKLLEGVAKTFIGLLKPEKNTSENRALLKFLADMILYKAYHDMSFRHGIAEMSFSQLLKLLESPAFIEERFVEGHYPTCHSEKFYPWSDEAATPAKAKEFYHWSPEEIRSFFEEIFADNYEQIIEEGRDGEASTHRCMVGDFTSTLARPKIMDIGSSVRGLSHIPRILLPLYLDVISRALQPGGVVLSDDIHHDSIRNQLGIFEWSDLVATSDGKLRAWTPLLGVRDKARSKAYIPRVVFLASQAPNGTFFDFRTSMIESRGITNVFNRDLLKLARTSRIMLTRLLQGLLGFGTSQEVSIRNQAIPAIVERTRTEMRDKRRIPSRENREEAVRCGDISPLFNLNDAGELGKLKEVRDTGDDPRRHVARFILEANRIVAGHVGGFETKGGHRLVPRRPLQ